MEPGSYLRMDGGAIAAWKGDQALERIPVNGLKKLILVGRSSLSGAVLDYLIDQRVETVLLTPSGRYRARIGIDEHRHVALRKGQYLNLSDNTFAITAAGRIVAGKIENMANFTLLWTRKYPDEALKLIAIRLKAMAASATGVADLEKLRGWEGAATRLYFLGFSGMVRNDNFTFKGRNRRPPLDPINALLSFVYTLLTNEVLSAVKAVGLDPYLGALHEISYGRPSLACDLVEEYRSFLGDRLVLGLVNRKMITPDDFVYRKAPAEFVDEEDMRQKRPVEMKPAVRRTFVAAYENMMQRTVYYAPLKQNLSYRWMIYQQVKRFGEYLVNPEGVYEPHIWVK